MTYHVDLRRKLRPGGGGGGDATLATRRLAALSRAAAGAILIVVILPLLVGPSAADLVDKVSSKAAPTKTHGSGPEALDIIKARGFIGEQYNVPSRDGTILSLYHIVNPLASPKTLNKFPVLINHGVLGDAAQMLGHSETARPRRPLVGELTVEPSDTCIAFFLANNNFDIWMFDARGTNLNNHRVSDDLGVGEGARFWDFGLDEQILQDLPTAVDFVLGQTHAPKLHYIAYSESTLFMFALLSHWPHYADKLASFVALAPISYLENISGLALSAFMPATLVPDSINGNYVPQLLADTLIYGLHAVCQNKLAMRTLCDAGLSGVAGVGPNAAAPGLYATMVKSTSLRSAKHFLQFYSQKRVGMYDYGQAKNMALYGQATPPPYDFKRIRLPYIILFRGDRDLLSDLKDQEHLLREMGTKPYLDFRLSNYNHFDFLLGKTIVEDINAPAGRAMLELLKLQTLNATHGFLRDPQEELLPRPFKPVAISLPDGNRRLEVRNDLAHNLVETLAETIGDKAPGGGGHALGLLRGLGDKIDFHSSQLTKLGDVLTVGSVDGTAATDHR